MVTRAMYDEVVFMALYSKPYDAEGALIYERLRY